MLQVENLNKSFGSKQVLFDINFKADNGKILGLIGKNGSGKTTLFHSILKFVKYQGKITIDGHSYLVTIHCVFMIPRRKTDHGKITFYF